MGYMTVSIRGMPWVYDYWLMLDSCNRKVLPAVDSSKDSAPRCSILHALCQRRRRYQASHRRGRTRTDERPTAGVRESKDSSREKGCADETPRRHQQPGSLKRPDERQAGSEKTIPGHSRLDADANSPGLPVVVSFGGLK